jgi:hypothetical protein
LRPSTGAKSNNVGIQSVGIEGILHASDNSLLQKNFRRFGAPMHLIRVRNAG